MKYFTHYCNLKRSELIAGFLDQCGKDALEGYGFLCSLIELIAEQMTTRSREPRLTLSPRQWKHQLDCHHHKFDKYLNKLRDTGVVTVEKLEDNLRVTVPELSKWADEYFKKSRQRRDSVGTQEKRTDKTKREELVTKRSRNATSLPKDLSLTGARRDVAAKNCPGADVDSVFEKFCAHHRSHGRTSLDWNAEWEMWTLREGEWMRDPPLPHGRGNGKDQRKEMMGMANLMGVKRIPGESESEFFHRIEIANEHRMERDGLQ